VLIRRTFQNGPWYLQSVRAPGHLADLCLIPLATELSDYRRAAHRRLPQIVSGPSIEAPRMSGY
jgi:hypothetical protein